jgi:hypothetical protein
MTNDFMMHPAVPGIQRAAGWRATLLGAAALIAGAALALAPAGAHAQTPLMDLDAAAGTGVFDVFDDGGLLARGSFGTGTVPWKGAGVRFMWYPAKAAFRAGRVSTNLPAAWDDANVGEYSLAFGNATTASGMFGFAHGNVATASGQASTAFGEGTTAAGARAFAAGYAVQATGDHSVAFGSQSVASAAFAFAAGNTNTASGQAAAAFGYNNTASGSGGFAAGNSNQATGDASVALGFAVSATGLGAIALGRQSSALSSGIAIGYNVAGTNGSVAIGNTVSTGTRSGSVAMGDNALSGNTTVLSANNQFGARFTGGYRFFTNTDATVGAYLAPGGSSWSSLSDANAKENFVDLDATAVLDAVDGLDIREWNYIANDDRVRHIGPTAQSFHAAFGLGGDPLRIETLDADGVALAAIQALIRENRAMAAEKAALEARMAELEADAGARDDRIAELEARLRQLAELLDGRAESPERPDSR